MAAAGVVVPVDCDEQRPKRILDERAQRGVRRRRGAVDAELGTPQKCDACEQLDELRNNV